MNGGRGRIGALVAAALAVVAVVGLSGCGPVDPRSDAGSWRGGDEAPRVDARLASLGRDMFFDVSLSKGRDMSCATCHVPSLGWAPPRDRTLDAGGPRPPTLVDVGDLGTMGWDGHFPTLESVTFAPITSPVRMGMTEVEAIGRMAADPRYGARFVEATGRPADKAGMEAAMAEFERTIRHGRAPFDAWLDGDDGAMTPAQVRGFALFKGKAACSACHSGASFTDGSYHDVGVGDGVGRGKAFPSSGKLQHAWKTPTLRDVALRGPYFHDGSATDLRAVVDHYDRGGIDRTSRGDGVRPLGLDDGEKADLVAFMGALTSAH